MDEKVAKTPRPHMLDADEVARGRVVIRGRVRSDVFDALYFPEVD